jgi:hypothetical protein
MNPKAIIVGLIIVGALGGAYETIALSKKRDALLAQVVKLKADRDKNNEALRSARVNARTVEGEINRQQENWGQEWEAPNSTPLPQSATIQLGIGTNVGLGAREQATKAPPPVVHIFAENPDGTSRYLGEFQVEAPNANQTLATLTRPPYDGEVQSWAPGTYRVRQFVPSAARTALIDLQTQQVIADQQVIDETAKLTIQDKHIADSTAALNRRLAELNGDPDAPAKASDDVKNGYVESLRLLEVERNTIAGDVDKLRRSLSNTYAELKSVLKQNESMVDAMSTEVGEQTAATPSLRAPR